MSNKLTNNPGDYIFAIVNSSFGPWHDILITPDWFFTQEGCMYDQHLTKIDKLLSKNGFESEMEGYYCDSKNRQPQEIFDALTTLGFIWSEPFAQFVGPQGYFVPGTNTGQTQAVKQTPGVNAVAPSSPEPWAIGRHEVNPPPGVVLAPTAGGKIDTAMCKDAIVAFVRANPGLVSTEFCGDGPDEVIPCTEIAKMDADASNLKNWKRHSKEKYGKGNVRTFDCTPFDDQLRAYVYDDGLKITKIIVLGE